MSMEERFKAAVNVIKGLPPKGSYQPSYDMMLRFYSYFKQATEGPCKSRRPAFWDIVGKAKYDAWKRLGDMPKEKAMESYVDELKKIVETMSFTANVADFYESLSELDKISVEDLELVAPEFMRSKSQSNSPLRERIVETIRDINDIPNETYTAASNGRQNARTYSSSPSETSTDDDEEYIDTVEDEIVIAESRPALNYTHHNGGIAHKKPMTEVTNKLNIDPSIVTHLVHSITDNMKADLQQVNTRLNVLEQKKIRS
ncbi:acyl-CoA-binding domain-containing protein 5A isoform X2 [Chironomus tepperi]|uniref:acyl-CoA-binding domain-containing protein 5A isoform X2 n=1 Tax=Chironomus tepperi TaxID=113505 RepID=UPI00391F7F43